MSRYDFTICSYSVFNEESINTILNNTVGKDLVITDDDDNNYNQNTLICVSLWFGRCLHSVFETFHHCQADHGISIADLVKKHSKCGPFNYKWKSFHKSLAQWTHSEKLHIEVLVVAPLSNTGHVLQIMSTKQNIQMCKYK